MELPKNGILVQKFPLEIKKSSKNPLQLLHIEILSVLFYFYLSLLSREMLKKRNINRLSDYNIISNFIKSYPIIWV